MADGRNAILEALRATSRAPEDRPAPTGNWLRFDDPVAVFEAAVETAGGRCVRLEAPALEAFLRETVGALPRERVFSVLDPSLHSEGSSLADLEFAILRGGPAVAESGAVWWAPETIEERAAGYLAAHVVLVTPRALLVDHLHAAYAQIDPAAHGFACFVAGPSKTADIEQALVIGAHGPRSLTVVLLG